MFRARLVDSSVLPGTVGKETDEGLEAGDRVSRKRSGRLMNFQALTIPI